MFETFSLIVMLLVVLFLMAGGVRTLIRGYVDKNRDASELLLTILVLFCLLLYGISLGSMLILEIFFE